MGNYQSSKRTALKLSLFVPFLFAFVLLNQPAWGDNNKFIQSVGSFDPRIQEERAFCSQITPLKSSPLSDHKLAFRLFVAIVTNTAVFLETGETPSAFYLDTESVFSYSKQLISGQSITVDKSFSDRLTRNPSYRKLWLSLGVNAQGQPLLASNVNYAYFEKDALKGFITKTLLWLGKLDGLYGTEVIRYSFVQKLANYILATQGDYYGNLKSVHLSITQLLNDTKRALNQSACQTPSSSFLKSMLLLLAQT